MLNDLYDMISQMFSWRWPTAQGEITALDLETVVRRRGNNNLRLAVAYKFSVGDDGPYTGESSWEPFWSEDVLAARNSLQVGQSVTVRYRPKGPSVSTLDRRVWRDL
jgi:uncharacterized protein DUF3592